MLFAAAGTGRNHEAPGFDRAFPPVFQRIRHRYGHRGGVQRSVSANAGDTIVYHDDSLSIVKALKGKVKQYVVSNGTVVAQTKKLQKSGLGKEMDGVFLSERLGVEKPNSRFFEKVFSQIRPDDLSAVLIVGGFADQRHPGRHERRNQNLLV